MHYLKFIQINIFISLDKYTFLYLINTYLNTLLWIDISNIGEHIGLGINHSFDALFNRIMDFGYFGHALIAVTIFISCFKFFR